MATYEELLEHDNPYEQLKNGGGLNSHAGEFRKVPKEQWTALATNIVLGCPEEDRRSFVIEVKALMELMSRDKSQGLESFGSSLYRAQLLKTHIHALLDPKNKNPHRIFTEEFDGGMFNEFPALAKKLIKGKENEIALRLVTSTPEKDKNAVLTNIGVATNIKSIEGNSRLTIEVSSAFVLRRLIDVLLSPYPAGFFSSEEYRPGLCHSFQAYLATRISGFEQNIGINLAETTTIDQRKKISTDLSAMTSATHPANDLITKILVAMQSRVDKLKAAEPKNADASTTTSEQTQTTPPSLPAVAGNTNSMFPSPSGATRRKAEGTTPETSDSSSSDEDDDGGYSCFGYRVPCILRLP